MNLVIKDFIINSKLEYHNFDKLYHNFLLRIIVEMTLKYFLINHFSITR